MLVDDRRVVPMTLLAQAGASLAVACVLGFWLGATAAASAALGGVIAVVPNAFLAARLVKPRASAAAALRAAWIGEIGKWLLTALLFGAVFASLRPVSAPALFSAFVAAQLAVLGALLWGGARAARG